MKRDDAVKRAMQAEARTRNKHLWAEAAARQREQRTANTTLSAQLKDLQTKYDALLLELAKCRAK